MTTGRLKYRLAAALTWALFGVVVLAAGALATSVLVSRPQFDETLDPSALNDPALAPPGVALTFARARVGGQLRVLLAMQVRDGKVVAIDLNRRFGLDDADPLSLYRRLGYTELATAARSIADVVAVDLSALEVPFDAPERNIGVGLNYREHAQESSLDEEPFLFPKFAAPTPAMSDIAKGGSTLLDYEAELGLVALEDLTRDSPPRFGLVLANEVTDRWPLVRGFDRSAPMGTTGFADGKSREGFAPLGPFLVIPRDLGASLPRIELRLYLNGRLRQKESAGAMRWGPQRIMDEVFGRAAWAHDYAGGAVPLLDDPAVIPAGTILFSGTPAGVIFRPLNLINPWVYLQPGDEVVIRADALGSIRNRIVD